MFRPNKVIKSIAFIVSVLTISFSLAYFVLAWTEPTAAPPTGNVSTPLNVGSTGQSKQGGLILNTGGATNGLIVQSGNVQIGGAMIFGATTQPAVSLPGQVTMYYDDTTKDLKVSINSQPYTNLTTASGATIPATITNLSASGDVGQVSLSWSVPSNGGRTITGYRIYRGPSSGGEVYLTTVAINSFTNSGLTNGTAYYYKVSAVNSIGEASLSNEVNATPGLLTWSGSTHNVDQCTANGGSVYNTGVTGTICRYPGSTIPSGWAQAANWQRYNTSTWGGDGCGWHVSSGPATFVNISSTSYSQGTLNESRSGYYCNYYLEDIWFSGGHRSYNLITTLNGTANRAEIGIY